MKLRADEVTVLRRGDSVLSGLSFSLSAGEWVDLEGPSGGGKSTLLGALARMVPRACGRLELDGQPAEAIPAPYWRAQVCMVGQQPQALPGDVASNLRSPWSLGIRAREAAPEDGVLRDSLARIGLTELSLGTDASRLSGGQLARLGVLRALLAAPAVLLLDEPDAMLDEDSARLLAGAVAAFCAAGGAVLRVSHRRSGVPRSRLRLEGGELRQEG